MGAAHAAAVLFGPPLRRPRARDADEAFNTTWHLSWETSVEDHGKRRRRQVAELAYYGKQPMLSWDERLGSEIDEAHGAIAEVVNAIAEQVDR